MARCVAFGWVGAFVALCPACADDAPDAGSLLPVIDTAAVPFWEFDDTTFVTSGNAAIPIYSPGEPIILEDGTVALVNGLGDQLVFLDAAGSMIASTTTGRGPGEISGRMGIRGVFHAGDDVAIYEREQHRISLYASSGEHVRDMQLQSPGVINPVGWIDDVGFVSVPFRPRDVEHRPYSIWNEEGVVARTIEGPPSRSRFDVQTNEGTTVINCLEPVRRAEVIIDNVIYAADGSGGRVVAIGANGTSRVIFETPFRRTVTQAAHDAATKYLRVMGDAGEHGGRSARTHWRHRRSGARCMAGHPCRPDRPDLAAGQQLR